MKVTVQPGEEATICKNFPMPQGAFDIGEFEHAMTPVSHHLLVYQLNLAADFVTDDLIYACDELERTQRDRIGILYGTQSETSDLRLPDGIAFAARGGLAVQLEYHVLNTSDQVVDAEVAFNLWRRRGEINGEAGMLFMFNNRIAIPPNSTGSARQRCTVPNDVELMMLVPHMHSRGVAMQALHDRGDGAPVTLFDVQGWENDTVMYDPPVSVAPGDVIDFACQYNNPTNNYVFDGFSARNNEMCVTGGIYYRHGDRLPIQDEFCFGEGIVYSGTNSCLQINACEEAIDFSPTAATTPEGQFDLCVLAGCQSGADAFTAFDACRWDNCGQLCVDPVGGVKFTDPACVTCIDTSCAVLRDACTANACQ
jgi:hypothetical protein